MVKYIILTPFFALAVLPVAFFAYAQDLQTLNEDSPAVRSELPPSPVREAVLELLRPEEWFRTLQQYIKVPLPGSNVKDIEVSQEKVSELNVQITAETGVDIIKFFKFIGKVLIIVLEGLARIIRGLLSGV